MLIVLLGVYLLLQDQTVAVWDFLSPTTITLRTVVKGLNGAVLALDLTDTKIISGAGYCNYYPIKVWSSCDYC